MVKRAQYKIQQMAFMILAIFFFFSLVGIFFAGFLLTQMRSDFAQLQESKALSSLKVIVDSTELNCQQNRDWCIDKDKLVAFRENSYLYDDFWTAASIEVLIVYPRGNNRTAVVSNSQPSSNSGSSNVSVTYGSGRSAGGSIVPGGSQSGSGGSVVVSYGEEPILCPGPNCDYYVLYDNGQANKQTFSAYITVCEQIDRTHEICELGKLMVGVPIRNG